ncbi:MAG: molybdenum cofactor guanylyltransferase [Candidatus Eremiobacteraeota bacterium]|nr:molybdenum cofactor guanylyltransferase [Candidatus Eremiobacteraeota bacterium]
MASSTELAPEIRELVDVPVVTDREPGRGPVAGLLAAFATMRSSPIFAVAGDAPFVDAAFVRGLATHWRPGDEAVLPFHDDGEGATRTEPLAALYDRAAFLRAGTEVVRSGRGAMRLVVEALATRYVRVEEETSTFANVNTPADDAAFRAELRNRGDIV